LQIIDGDESPVVLLCNHERKAHEVLVEMLRHDIECVNFIEINRIFFKILNNFYKQFLFIYVFIIILSLASDFFDPCIASEEITPLGAALHCM
jgi:hypothetical protein